MGRAPIRGRGLRVLTMDGGGMKGIATLRLLRQVIVGSPQLSSFPLQTKIRVEHITSTYCAREPCLAQIKPP